MLRLKKDETGFSIAGALIVLVILAVFGIVGAFIAKHFNNETIAATPTTNIQYLKITQLGIELPLTSTTADMSYTWNSTDNSALLGSASLLSEAVQADPTDCTATSSPIYPISFISTATTHAGSSGVLKSVSINGTAYNWFLPGAGEGCASGASYDSAFISTQLPAYYNQALSSFAQAKEIQ